MAIIHFCSYPPNYLWSTSGGSTEFLQKKNIIYILQMYPFNTEHYYFIERLAFFLFPYRVSCIQSKNKIKEYQFKH